jgi:tetratricopeptide (TPR) repeat protein
MKDYDDLPLEDKYKANLREFRQDRINSLKRMEKLALDDNYENAQLYLAEYYRMSVFGDKSIEKTINFYKISLQKNTSFDGSLSLGALFWSDGDYDEAKKYCEIANKIATEKRLDSSKVDLLLNRIKLDENF